MVFLLDCMTSTKVPIGNAKITTPATAHHHEAELPKASNRAPTEALGAASDPAESAMRIGTRADWFETALFLCRNPPQRRCTYSPATILLAAEESVTKLAAVGG
jgi:hypothetical protein